MPKLVLTNGVAMLEFARRVTLGLLEDIPEDKLFYQPFPGANHALWIIGHVAWDDNFFLTTLGGKQTDFPPAWNELFGVGSVLQPEPAAYPSLAEIRQQLEARRAGLIEWFKSMDGDQLVTALPEDYQTFARDYAALMTSIAWHEGLHAGQLTVVRKALGLKPRFM